VMREWKGEMMGREERLKRNRTFPQSPGLASRFATIRQDVQSRNKAHIDRYLHGKYLLVDPEARAEWLRNKVSHRKICIFGAGSYGDKVYRHLRDNGYPIACFSDNNPDIWTKTKYGIPIVAPDDIQPE